MGKEIELIKVKDMPGFDPKNFCMDTKFWNYTCGLYYDLEEVKTFHKARELAKNVKEICIAFVHDNNWTDFVFGNLCCEGKVTRLILFNAEECDESKAQIVGYVCCDDNPSVKIKKFFRYRPDHLA